MTASAGFSELDSAGPLHVVVDDWNLDDEVLDLVARDYELQPEEAEFVALLKRMPYDQRLSAAALSSQFWAY